MHTFRNYMVECYGDDHGGGFCPNTRKKHRCGPIYMDKDVVGLCLLAHRRNMFVYRQTGSIKDGENTPTEDKSRSTEGAKENKGIFKMIRISPVRETMISTIGIPNGVRTFASEIQIRDLMFLALLNGDDCLPGKASAQFQVFNNMVKCYKGNNGKYLTNFDEVNYDHLSELIRKVGEKELDMISKSVFPI